MVSVIWGHKKWLTLCLFVTRLEDNLLYSLPLIDKPDENIKFNDNKDNFEYLIDFNTF